MWNEVHPYDARYKHITQIATTVDQVLQAASTDPLYILVCKKRNRGNNVP
jgi:hypothetical protein